MAIQEKYEQFFTRKFILINSALRRKRQENLLLISDSIDILIRIRRCYACVEEFNFKTYTSRFWTASKKMHPGLYPCIEGLQKDNAEVRLVMVQSQNGRPFRTRTKRNYEISQRSLRRACQLFQNGHYANNIQGYLERISHAIRF